jgi:hypothetical protein
MGFIPGVKAPGLLQTLMWAARLAAPTPVSRFMSLRETETESEQPVLLAHHPDTREIKVLPQPQHGLEPPDRPSCRVEQLKAADPRRVPLDPEVIALDPLLQVLADVVERVWRQIEGQINRLKMLKRTMYDRAGLDLLSRRVLLAA